MSGGKKKSGFQITSVTSDSSQPTTPASQSSHSVVRTVQSDPFSIRHIQGSSSQPTTPSLRRKNISHDAPGQGAGCSSRFRVVRLTGGGAGRGGRSKSYQRGRWTCMEFMERPEEAGFRRVMDSMRHAHSLESLEMIGRDRERGGVHSQDTTLKLTHAVNGTDRTGLILRSGPPSPTYQEPISIQLLDRREPIRVQDPKPTPTPASPRPQNFPRPLQLEVDATRRSVLRMSQSLPSSPLSEPYHPTLTPTQTLSAFSLDQTIFGLQGDNSASSNSYAIDNKIEQAMDLVKSHLMLAVREEVELLRDQIRELQEKNQQLERENHILRALTHNYTTSTQHNSNSTFM
ncbi:TSC22 domain family protein 4 [Kryptolebias marmoratus]|uniref:TSC22 domain family protein 4-like n=1 Tax=Kryptolebias marmoratus TaxID=37003 RepID=A0A3Q3ESW9_KRYMA|nr:TSC22 domain family protein 4 [Kryptolebias marmoratus]XP_017292946.1 TSC22 domain family protein 4 [Kryptolebias marmoratus]XP_017292947.1 TSC22 domain family protein 4 [Kryptolebias marmoratus]